MDFLLGGIAAMGAGIFSNPFDVIKTRMQLQVKSDLKIIYILRQLYIIILPKIL